MKLFLTYAIRNRKTGEFYETREMELDVESVLNGVRDQLCAPISLDMENEWEYCYFELLNKEEG